MVNTWLIGCTHFGHSNIIKFANRPFNDVNEMNETIVQNWNDTVGTKDIVYHLGDFSFKGGHYENYIKRLNGNIVQIKGNHDKKFGQFDYKEIVVDGRLVVMMHYPIEEWNGWYRKSVHFHCHTHKHEFVSAVRRGNVTVEAIGYKPIHIEDAIKTLMENDVINET